MPVGKPLEVRAVPVQPHCFHFGGFDIQMYRALELLRGQGISARPLDFWSRDESFDILHVWGLEPMHLGLVKMARAYGKRVVISALLPYLGLDAWIRHLGGLVEGRRRVLGEILRYTDRLLVHNDLQVETAVAMFRFPRDRVQIIPSILDPYFFDPRPMPPLDDLVDYVACVGNILPRKNQLRLAEAARAVQRPMVFVGNTMGGHEAYTARFADVIRQTPFLRWFKWVSYDDMRRVYWNASAIALASFQETQPGAAFEGAAMSKPLLLGDRPYARQSYFRGAYLADPNSLQSISRGLEALEREPIRHIPPKELMAACNPEVIALDLKKVFEGLAP